VEDDDDAMQQAWEQELEEFLTGESDEDERNNRENRSSAAGSAEGNHVRIEGCNEPAL
jgi:hypothetical protein